MDLDTKTIEYYKKLEGDFGVFVRENVDLRNGCVKMDENGRCPFLNRNNLCDIILNCGEEHISYICTHHPRFYNEFSNFTEMGMGLCCEEAARLLMSGNIRIEKEDNYGPLHVFRNELMEMILCNRFSLKEKVYYFLDLCCEADDYIFNGKSRELSCIINKYDFKSLKGNGIKVSKLLEIAEKTEPIDKKWKNRLKHVAGDCRKIEANINEVVEINKDRYERLFYYYTFRYLISEDYGEEILANAKLIIFLLYLNIIFDTVSYADGEKDFNPNTILISKQMEYSEDNICFLLACSYDDPALSFSNLVGEE